MAVRLTQDPALVTLDPGGSQLLRLTQDPALVTLDPGGSQRLRLTQQVVIVVLGAGSPVSSVASAMPAPCVACV